MTWDALAAYLVSGYSVVRSNEHIVSGNNESMIIIHDCFQPLSNWDFFFTNYAGDWTNYGIDTHLYQAFNDYPNLSDVEHLQSTCAQQSSLVASQKKLPTVSIPSTQLTASRARLIDITGIFADGRRVLPWHSDVLCRLQVMCRSHYERRDHRDES